MNTSDFYTSLMRADFADQPVQVFDGVEFDEKTFLELLESSNDWKIISSSDGPVSHVFEDPMGDAMDHSHTSNYFGLHTDGQYLDEVPPICLLYCADAGSGGTPTVFGDSRLLVKKLEEKGMLELAQEFDFIYTKKEGKEFRRPLIEKNPVNGELVMCVATKSPPIQVVPKQGSMKTQQEADAFFDELSELAESTLELSVHEWKTGQVVAFDNVSLIHGRGLAEQKDQQITDANRHLVRIWLARK